MKMWRFFLICYFISVSVYFISSNKKNFYCLILTDSCTQAVTITWWPTDSNNDTLLINNVRLWMFKHVTVYQTNSKEQENPFFRDICSLIFPAQAVIPVSECVCVFYEMRGIESNTSFSAVMLFCSSVFDLRLWSCGVIRASRGSGSE